MHTYPWEPSKGGGAAFPVKGARVGGATRCGVENEPPVFLKLTITDEISFKNFETLGWERRSLGTVLECGGWVHCIGLLRVIVRVWVVVGL